MINTDNVSTDEKTQEAATPDENNGVVVQGFIKIYDPESGEILVQARA